MHDLATPPLASDLLPYDEAARLKGCIPQTLRNAAQRGDVREYRIGRSCFVVRDDAFHAFEVKETGGRLHGKNA
ncbi:MAG: hypothetical protein AAGN64_01000 [Bacteroidota bacterium]